MAFEKPIPQWFAAGAEPPESLKQSGFTVGYKPPADYFNWFWYCVSQCLAELQDKHTGLETDHIGLEEIVEELQKSLENIGDGDYLPLSGGALTGGLTVIDNLNVNRTYNDEEYKTYIRPINYSIGNNGDYSTGLIHYKGEVNQAQLMFNKDGVMLRDNVLAKAYQLFGQHNGAAAATAVRPHLYTYGTTDMTAGSSSLETGKIYLVYE